MGGDGAADGHPPHERTEDDPDGGRGGTERQQEQSSPRELENEGSETADEEGEKQQDASRGHVES